MGVQIFTALVTVQEPKRITRQNVRTFVPSALNDDKKGARLLDVAPQDYQGEKEYFKHADLETLDIDPNSGADYIVDLCANNRNTIAGRRFDFIVCTEVLE